MLYGIPNELCSIISNEESSAGEVVRDLYSKSVVIAVELFIRSCRNSSTAALVVAYASGTPVHELARYANTTPEGIEIMLDNLVLTLRSSLVVRNGVSVIDFNVAEDILLNRYY
jgi:hypothetical protein